VYFEHSQTCITAVKAGAQIHCFEEQGLSVLMSSK